MYLDSNIKNYIDYYMENNVTLLLIYNNPNDKVDIDMIDGIYPNKEIVDIDVTTLYQYDGMLHCIIKQQLEVLKVNNRKLTQ